MPLMAVPEHLVIEDTLDPERPNPWAAAGHDYRPEVRSPPMVAAEDR